MFIIIFYNLFILTGISAWQWRYVIAKRTALKHATSEFQLVEDKLHWLQMENPVIAKHKSLKRQLSILQKQLLSERLKFE